MDAKRYVVQLRAAGLGDMIDIHLPDGRSVTITHDGQLTVSKYDDGVGAGYARMLIPDPELSASDHEGYVWEAKKTRRRHL